MNASPYRPVRARVESIVEECGGMRPIRTLAVSRDEPSPGSFSYRPGQCVQLSVMGAGEVMLSIASAPADTATTGRLELSVMQVGQVTTALHQLEVGCRVGLRGPYGNGFPVDEWRGKDLVLIGGGIGQAPLRSLLHHAIANRREFGRLRVFYGARSVEAMIYRRELAELERREDVDLYLSIDWKCGPHGLLDEDAATGWPRIVRDAPLRTRPAAGQRRFTGFVPEVLQAVTPPAEGAIAVTCGPPAMIVRVLDALQRIGFAAGQVFTTLERRMKCGIGLCGRCNLGPALVCTDGPVFSHQQLLSLPEAFA